MVKTPKRKFFPQQNMTLILLVIILITLPPLLISTHISQPSLSPHVVILAVIMFMCVPVMLLVYIVHILLSGVV